MFDEEKDARDREKARRSMEATRAKRQAEGRCTRCGTSEVAPERKLCTRCVEELEKRRSERRAWLKARGFCINCGKVRAEPGKQKCEMCNLRRAEYYVRYEKEHENTRQIRNERAYQLRRERSARWVAEGKCRLCGKAPWWDGTRTCMECTIRERRRNAAWRKEQRWKRPAKPRKVRVYVPRPMPANHPWRLDNARFVFGRKKQ